MSASCFRLVPCDGPRDWIRSLCVPRRAVASLRISFFAVYAGSYRFSELANVGLGDTQQLPGLHRISFSFVKDSRPLPLHHFVAGFLQRR